MSHKFNVGDTVWIKNQARRIEPKANIYFVEEMMQYYGKIVVVFDVKNEKSGDLYRLRTMNGTPIGAEGVNQTGYWLWDENWLDLVDARKIEITTEDIIDAFT
jgi:hypothetical protein